MPTPSLLSAYTALPRACALRGRDSRPPDAWPRSSPPDDLRTSPPPSWLPPAVLAFVTVAKPSPLHSSQPRPRVPGMGRASAAVEALFPARGCMRLSCAPARLIGPYAAHHRPPAVPSAVYCCQRPHCELPSRCRTFHQAGLLRVLLVAAAAAACSAKCLLAPAGRPGSAPLRARGLADLEPGQVWGVSRCPPRACLMSEARSLGCFPASGSQQLLLGMPASGPAAGAVTAPALVKCPPTTTGISICTSTPVAPASTLLIPALS